MTFTVVHCLWTGSKLFSVGNHIEFIKIAKRTRGVTVILSREIVEAYRSVVETVAGGTGRSYRW